VDLDGLLGTAPAASGIFDACNLLPDPAARPHLSYDGIGRGTGAPTEELVNVVVAGFQAVERGVANEVHSLIEFLNQSFAATPFERVDFAEVQRLAATCGTGCRLVDPGPLDPPPEAARSMSRLVARAAAD
jgi:hypothetical protein